MLETHQGLNHSWRRGVCLTDYEQIAGEKERVYSHCHLHSLSCSLSLFLSISLSQTHTHLPLDGQRLC